MTSLPLSISYFSSKSRMPPEAAQGPGPRAPRTRDKHSNTGPQKCHHPSAQNAEVAESISLLTAFLSCWPSQGEGCRLLSRPSPTRPARHEHSLQATQLGKECQLKKHSNLWRIFVSLFEPPVDNHWEAESQQVEIMLREWQFCPLL